MVIGIDIDDTITNSSDIFIEYAKKYNCENDIKYKIDISKLDQMKAFGWDRNHQINFQKENLEHILVNCSPKKNAVEIIRKLKREGNKILFITARNNSELSNVYDITEKWLLCHNFEFDKLIVNSVSKAEECRKSGVELFIDDSIKNCESIYKQLKIPVFMFNTRYNKYYDNSEIKRVFNWDEIYLKIKEMRG